MNKREKIEKILVTIILVILATLLFMRLGSQEVQEYFRYGIM